MVYSASLRFLLPQSRWPPLSVLCVPAAIRQVGLGGMQNIPARHTQDINIISICYLLKYPKSLRCGCKSEQPFHVLRSLTFRISQAPPLKGLSVINSLTDNSDSRGIFTLTLSFSALIEFYLWTLAISSRVRNSYVEELMLILAVSRGNPPRKAFLGYPAYTTDILLCESFRSCDIAFTSGLLLSEDFLTIYLRSWLAKFSEYFHRM